MGGLLCSPLFVSQVSSSVRHLWKIRADVCRRETIRSSAIRRCNKMTPTRTMDDDAAAEEERSVGRDRSVVLGERSTRGWATSPKGRVSTDSCSVSCPSATLSVSVPPFIRTDTVRTHSSDAITDHLPLPLTLSHSLSLSIRVFLPFVFPLFLSSCVRSSFSVSLSLSPSILLRPSLLPPRSIFLPYSFFFLPSRFPRPLPILFFCFFFLPFSST